ncbi:MAG: ABC transporter substrate-binding protein [Candidatus Rokubacteria bacterium]|nr:ABC transporter substrate-binding protein [Candidatus Rokubacteria bacterium]
MKRVAVLLALLASVTLPPAPGAAAEKIKITIPAAAVTFASLYHAKTAGYFAEEGLDVEIVTVAGGASLQALIAKDAQFCVTPSTYQIQAWTKGQKLIATGSIMNRNAINVVMHKDVAKEKGITEKTPLAEKIKALKGLKLSGTAVGSFSYEVLVYYLLRAGIDPQKDVQLIGIGAGPAMALALEQRKVDGFATGTPIPDAAVLRGYGVMIVDNAAGEDPEFAEFMMNSVLVHPDYAKQNPEIVRKVLRALVKANAYVLDQPIEKLVSSMKPFLGALDDKILSTGLAKVKLGIRRGGRITEQASTLTQDFMRKIGQLKTTIPYTELVTHEYLPK